MKNLLIIAFIALVVGSCNRGNEILGHKIFFPQTLELLNNHEYHSADSICNENLKLVCLINADCDECIHRVNSWQGFVDTLKILGINTHIILQTSNVRGFRKYFFEKFETKAIYYLDSNSTYYNSNLDLFSNEKINPYVLLLDSSNRIQMYGDPFLNTSTKDIYLYAISKYQDF